MSSIPDQIAMAARASFESNIALYASLTQNALEGVEKLINLNMTAVKASMEESSAATRQMLTAKDPQEFLALASAQARPNFNKALAYSNHLASIASTTQAEFTKAAERQIAEASRKVNDMMADAADRVPAGPGNMMAMVKSALENAAAGYQQLNKTTKQAVETMESNMNAATSTFTQTGKPKH